MRERRGEEIIESRRISFVGEQISAINIGTQRILLVNLIGDGVVKINDHQFDVDPGQSFRVSAKYISENIGGYSWKSCITVIDSTGFYDIKNYQSTGVSENNKDEFNISGYTAILDVWPDMIMPDADITLRLKLWMHDSLYVNPDHPPVELW